MAILHCKYDSYTFTYLLINANNNKFNKIMKTLNGCKKVETK